MMRSLAFLIGIFSSPCIAAEAAEAPPPAAPAASQSDDPLEGLNRLSFDVSTFVDRNALKPVAQAYVAAVPELVRDGLRNVLDNLDSPIVFANDALQGDGDAAGQTMARFLINSTAGVGGAMDPAADWGFARDSEDFGVTLGRWVVETGPYLFVPIVGPSSLRDGLGEIVDLAFDPITYWRGTMWVPIADAAADIVDTRARNLDSIDAIERTSIDAYAAVRSAYRQSRAAKVNKGETALPDLPND